MPEPAVENHAENPPEGGVTGKGFIAGQPSANPGGRPKGMARLARELVGKDGDLLLRFYAAAMGGLMTNPAFNDKEEESASNPRSIIVEPRLRLEAAKLLAERGFGKAPQYAPIEGSDPLEFTDALAVEASAALDARFDELAERRRVRGDASTG